MRLGLTLDGRGPVADALPVVRAADEAGLECVWVAEHLGHRDAMVYAATLLERTRRLAVGFGALSPYYRHPAQIAMGVATLRETYGPRVRLMLGLGNVADIVRVGAPAVGALRAVERAAGIVRALLEQGRADVRGEPFAASGLRLGVGGGPVPLYVAAVRDRMLRLAGRVGDGVSLSAASPPDYVRHALRELRAGAEEAGRDPGAIDVTCNVIVAVAASRREALARVKRQIGLIHAGGNHYLFRFQPGRVDPEGVRQALEAGEAAAMDRAIPDETADAMAVAATPDDVGERLAACGRAGVRLPLLRLVGTPAEQLEVLRLLRV